MLEFSPVSVCALHINGKTEWKFGIILIAQHFVGRAGGVLIIFESNLLGADERNHKLIYIFFLIIYLIRVVAAKCSILSPSSQSYRHILKVREKLTKFNQVNYRYGRMQLRGGVISC